jgi:YHS domain-containing protein
MMKAFAVAAVLAAIVVSAGEPINKKCPITGKEVAAGREVEYEKQTIGLCCQDCVGKFESDPKKYIGKVKEFKKKKSAIEMCCSEIAADPINKKCPLSGKDVDKEQTSTYQEQVIAFCCGGCKGKFDKEPEKFIGKVKEFKKKS